MNLSHNSGKSLKSQSIILNICMVAVLFFHFFPPLSFYNRKYLGHFLSYPHSLLVKYVGCYSIKFTGKQKVRQTHTHTRNHACTHAHTHTHTHTHAHTHACTLTHTHTRTRSHACTHACMHAHARTHARTHAHTHTQSS